MRIQKEYIKELERKIEELTKQIKDEQSKSGYTNQSLERELEELKAKNKEINQRMGERIEKLKRKIANLDDESKDLTSELIWSHNSRSKRNFPCRIM